MRTLTLGLLAAGALATGAIGMNTLGGSDTAKASSPPARVIIGGRSVRVLPDAQSFVPDFENGKNEACANGTVQFYYDNRDRDTVLLSASCVVG